MTFTALLLPPCYNIVVPVVHIALMMGHTLYSTWNKFYVYEKKTSDPHQWLDLQVNAEFSTNKPFSFKWTFGWCKVDGPLITATTTMTRRAINDSDFQMGLINISAVNSCEEICTQLMTRIGQYLDKDMLMQPVTCEEDAKHFMNMDIGGIILHLIREACAKHSTEDKHWLQCISSKSVE